MHRASKRSAARLPEGSTSCPLLERRSFGRRARPYIGKWPSRQVATRRPRVPGGCPTPGPLVTNTPDDDGRVRGSEPLSERTPMIRRAFLIAVAAVTMSAAAAMAFTPAFARASRSWTHGILRTTFGRTHELRSVGGGRSKSGALANQDTTVQGTFCPVRPPVTEQSAAIPIALGAQMSTDTRAGAAVDSSSLPAEESLLPPAPAICRAGSDTPPMQSTDRH
jgi:hypothetical protein